MSEDSKVTSSKEEAVEAVSKDSLESENAIPENPTSKPINTSKSISASELISEFEKSQQKEKLPRRRSGGTENNSSSHHSF